MYVVDAASWYFAVYGAVIAWRMSPKRLAQRSWRTDIRFHGQRHDKVGPGGIARANPDGTQVHIPWASIDHIRETEHAFHLLGRGGYTLAVLLKRGLDSPDLIPALREFLNHSAGGQLASASPGTAAGASQP